MTSPALQPMAPAPLLNSWPCSPTNSLHPSSITTCIPAGFPHCLFPLAESHSAAQVAFQLPILSRSGRIRFPQIALRLVLSLRAAVATPPCPGVSVPTQSATPLTAVAAPAMTKRRMMMMRLAAILGMGPPLLLSLPCPALGGPRAPLTVSLARGFLSAFSFCLCCPPPTSSCPQRRLKFPLISHWEFIN